VRGYMWKYPLHSLKYKVYALAMCLTRGGDIVDMEKHKLENVGDDLGSVRVATKL